MINKLIEGYDNKALATNLCTVIMSTITALHAKHVPYTCSFEPLNIEQFSYFKGQNFNCDYFHHSE